MAQQPTKDTWLKQEVDSTGQPVLVPVKVVDMDDAHLVSWVQYFRRKVRRFDTQITTAQIDTVLCSTMPTATAIFAEVVKRHLTLLPDVPLNRGVVHGNAWKQSMAEEVTRMGDSHKSFVPGPAWQPPRHTRRRRPRPPKPAPAPKLPLTGIGAPLPPVIQIGRRRIQLPDDDDKDPT